MGFPFKRIRALRDSEKPDEQTGQVLVLECDPEYVTPAVSVQPHWHNSLGIVRGVKENGALVEDHIREILDKSGTPIDVGETVGRLVGADKMRRQVWSVQDHREAYENAHPDEEVVAWVGNGNLLSNPHFLALAASEKGLVLYHLRNEARRFATRRYTCLVVRKDGFKPRVSIETLTLERRGDRIVVYSAKKQNITEEIKYATFGQQLVRKGKPITAEALVDMAKEGQFYDLRHLFLFGRLRQGEEREKRWMDAGLAAFWGNNSRLNKSIIGKALRATLEINREPIPVSVDVSQFDPEDVCCAMDDKSYDKVENSLSKPGQYGLKDGVLKVIFREGLYPHHMIGIRNGKILSVVLRGLSNRLGVTIRGAAELMEQLSVDDALLIDNGGDVMMSFGSEVVLGSAGGERNRLRSMVLYRKKKGISVPHDSLRLVIYPREKAEVM